MHIVYNRAYVSYKSVIDKKSLKNLKKTIDETGDIYKELNYGNGKK